MRIGNMEQETKANIFPSQKEIEYDYSYDSPPPNYCGSRSSTVVIILKTSVTEVKHRPLRIVLGWGTEVVD